MKTFLKIFSVLAVLTLIASLVPMSAMAYEPVTEAFKVKVTAKGPTPETPEVYTIRMTADGNYPMPGGKTGGSADLKITGPGSGTFPAMSFDNIGIYTYTIKMIAGKSLGVKYDSAVYHLKLTVVREDEKLVVYRALRKEGVSGKVDDCIFVVEYPSVSQIVKKAWDDSNNANKKRPTSVKVALKADGKTVKSVTLDENNGWAYTVRNLPVYRNGEKIKYTWEEETVTNYDLTSTKTSGTVTTLTNKEKKPNGPPVPPVDDLGMGMYVNLGECIE